MTSTAVLKAAAACAVVLLAGCAIPTAEQPQFHPGASGTAAPGASETQAAPGASETQAGKPPKVDGEPKARVRGAVIDTGIPATKENPSGERPSSENPSGKKPTSEKASKTYVIFGLTGSKQLKSEFGFALGIRNNAESVTPDMIISEYKGSASIPCRGRWTSSAASCSRPSATTSARRRPSP